MVDKAKIEVTPGLNECHDTGVIGSERKYALDQVTQGRVYTNSELNTLSW
jgi:hypothetical protein